jgi:hypothetical protein
MAVTAGRGARTWLIRRSATLLLLITISGLAAGGVARLAGADRAADIAWLAAAVCGLAYALWSAADALTTDPLAAPTAMAQVRHAHALLTGVVWPHENAEEAYLSLGEDADAFRSAS